MRYEAAGMGVDENRINGQVPMTVIVPTGGWRAIDVRELWHYRDLLRAFTERELKLRYRQTALGGVWVILQPLMAAAIFAFVFGRVAKLPSDGVPYVVFSFAGLLGWNLFSTLVTKITPALVQYSSLVSKIFFPRLLLPTAYLFPALVDLFVSAIAMVALMIAYRVPPTPRLALLPVWIAIVALLGLGIGLFTSSLTVVYRDINYIVPVAMQMLLYISPIAYAASVVPRSLRTAFAVNPLVGVFEAFRWSLLGQGSLAPWEVVYSGTVAILLLVVGAFSFVRMERRFADVI